VYIVASCHVTATRLADKNVRVTRFNCCWPSTYLSLCIIVENVARRVLTSEAKNPSHNAKKSIAV
jgi:hypothetical protein